MNLLRPKIKTFDWIFVSLFMVMAAGETFARYELGLGTPPLSIKHRTIEYMFKPNQDVSRFGNRVLVNQYGMRSEPFSERKEGDELRIMIFGDSVINGGNQTDHKELATSIIQAKLTHTTQRKVMVGNISAVSWGPGNWLAYAKEYGFFDADIVVLVISSHDYADNPTFAPLNKNTHPTVTPISALVEGIERNLFRPAIGVHKRGDPNHLELQVNEAEARRGLQDLQDFLALAKMKAKKVLVLQHLEKKELDQHSPGPGFDETQAICRNHGIETVSLEQHFRRSFNEGENPYRDNIHPNQAGQKLIAEAIIRICPIRAFKQQPDGTFPNGTHNPPAAG